MTPKSASCLAQDIARNGNVRLVNGLFMWAPDEGRPGDEEPNWPVLDQWIKSLTWHQLHRLKGVGKVSLNELQDFFEKWSVPFPEPPRRPPRAMSPATAKSMLTRVAKYYNNKQIFAMLREIRRSS